MKSLKLHNQRRHKKVANCNVEGNKGTVELSIDNAGTFANDRHFAGLTNEKNWISFSNNLCYFKIEDRSVTTVIHKSKADKHLVANSQDKECVDKNKLNKCADEEVTLLLNITKLSSNLKPKDN